MKCLFLTSLIHHTSVLFLISQELPISKQEDIEILIGTFRGNEERNYYGDSSPSDLVVKWKFLLGTGETTISRKIGSKKWSGAGWTGQPLFIREGSDTFLILGAFDHYLRKINIRDTTEVWRYKFDDVVKGTGTIYMNPNPSTREESVLILQGSRLGYGNYLDSKFIPSYRAISYHTGKEMWRLESKWTESYSRDVDGSALIFHDTAYIGLENGLFTVFDPDPARASVKDSMLQPMVIQQERLFTSRDVISHKNNIVTESSPAMLGERIYISSGSGHVYGFNLITRKLDWDFFIGSDLDGSVVITGDSCLLVSVEKQYIKGKGGVFKLNPSKQPSEAVIWYFEVQDTSFAGWEGGVIGTVGINDRYVQENAPHYAAIPALDGYLYIVDHQKIDTANISLGPDSISDFPAPVLVQKLRLGPSISSPIFTGDKMIFAGYNGIYLFNYSIDKGFERLSYYPAYCEAAPVILNRRLYIASRDGYLYCFGDRADK
jgi:outer membrane protein assembly factor BamB